MSTSDTVILMANGDESAQKLDERNIERLYEGIEYACRQMAQAIARDAEGSSKLITIAVSGAATEAEARQVGIAVANSSLVKTAAFGNDPNWGRILCAMGYAGVDFDPETARVSLCGTNIYGNGAGLDFDEDKLSAAMQAEEMAIDIDLAMGAAAAEIFTCDLTYEYVRLNAEYTNLRTRTLCHFRTMSSASSRRSPCRFRPELRPCSAPVSTWFPCRRASRISIRRKTSKTPGSALLPRALLSTPLRGRGSSSSRRRSAANSSATTAWFIQPTK